MDARREPGGGWMEVALTTPTGERITTYLARDASYSQRRTAWHLARAAKSLRTDAPGHKEVVTCRYVLDRNAVETEWRSELIASVGLDADKIKQDYNAMVARVPPPQRG